VPGKYRSANVWVANTMTSLWVPIVCFATMIILISGTVLGRKMSMSAVWFAGPILHCGLLRRATPPAVIQLKGGISIVCMKSICGLEICM